MASSTEQLTADFTEVQSTLELYPRINIIQVEGQPPDSYEIEYQITGCERNTDGTIRQASQHRIRISLPFGYPHFPPTVKPLSPVFHPDIDPDAIRITTYWQDNPSLPELILYIGEMISGNIYNLEDPFNQEAADWYAEHVEELPFDTLQVADIPADDGHLDTLNDDTFDLLGLEEEEPEEQSENIEQQLRLIQLRIEQKEMVAAKRLLADIPDAATLPERDEIEQVIISALRRGEELLERAKQLEKKGAIDDALELVEQAAERAADIPDLEDMRLRLQQAQVMAETFSEATPIPEITASSSAQKESASKSKQNGKKAAKTALAEPDFTGLPLKRILIGALLLLIAAAGTTVYLRDNSSLTHAESNWQKARNQLQNKDFQSAQKTAQLALTSLDSVLILRSKANHLQTKVSEFLNSTLLQKGLQGEIQYKGQYLPAETVASLQKLETLSDTAVQLLQENNVNAAIAAYETARDFARKNTLQPQFEFLDQAVNSLRFKETLASARRAEEAEEWENAAATYQRALEISKTLSNADETGEISKKLAAATFRHELDQSRTTFTEAQWQKTIDMLEDARKLLDTTPGTVSAEERNELEQLLAEARLYQLLSQGRQAYENLEWDAAVSIYQSSLDLLRDKLNIFSERHRNDAIKIEKTILMIKISREQNAATAAEQKNKLKKALEHYRAVQALTASSRFSEESDIKEIKKNAGTKISRLSAQVAMNDRMNWLMKNYKKIIREAYPSSNSSQLSRPKVNFIKKEKGRQIFQLTCIEKNQGSSFRLEIKYQFNPANGKWSIYYDQ